VHFDFDDDPAHKPLLPPPPPPRQAQPGGDKSKNKYKNKLGAARFHGHMGLAVRPGYEDRIRGGYAGFRNKVRFFGPGPPPPLPFSSSTNQIGGGVTKHLLVCIVPSDVVWRAYRRRIESSISRPTRTCRGPSAHPRLVLCQHPDGGSDK
jgi:hypothetical protein